ncbi:hypothetical protein [Chlorogloea sp. CCALA 695]|uniref:hypothetical protein n=1 Tax=Chlorogloea sp. CCALA 695 TaxID=2107693 RepID=UPI001304C195|nr:hypothetical protein [Chlorogloea sp. CCALA 695]
MTVVVQDNGSLHKSNLTRQQWQRWRSHSFVSVPPTPILFRNESDWRAMASTQDS